MAGRTPAEAVEAYRAPLQRALSCVTDRVLTIQGVRGGGYRPAESPHAIALNDGDPVTLRGAIPLAITVLQQYRIIETDDPNRGPWTVAVTAYLYALESLTDVPERRTEFVSYHRQPQGSIGASNPHLHIGEAAIGAAIQVGPRYLHRIHFPTGAVALEDVIRLAIAEFGATPLRDDWETVLAETQAAYLL